MVAKRVEDATAPAVAFSQWQWETEASQEQDAKEMAGVLELRCVWDGGEGAAAKWTRLGGHHGLAGWVKGEVKFRLQGSVGCLDRCTLPAPDKSWWSGSVEGRGWVVGLLGERCQGRGRPALLLEMMRGIVGCLD